MQAKPLCYAHKVLFKNTFYFENMFLIGLKPCSEFLQIYESGLTLFGCIMQNLQKKRRNRK
jgi:hypothetical protein